MKKWIALILAVVMLVAVFAACGKKDNGSKPGNEPQNEVDPVLNGELAAIIDAIYAIEPTPLPVMTMPVELTDEFAVSTYTGLTDASAIKEAVFSESMIGAQGYSIVLVRLNDAADAKTVANGMLNGVDQRKWICVEADDLRVVAFGDLVLLVMTDTNLEDISTDAYIEAFGKLCNNPFTADLRK